MIPTAVTGVRIRFEDRAERQVTVTLPPDRVFHLSEEAARLLALVDGRRDADAIALAYSRDSGRPVDGAAVERALREVLWPIGLVGVPDATPPVRVSEAPPPAGARLELLPPRAVLPLARALAPLHAPGVAIGLAVLALAGLAPALASAAGLVSGERHWLSPAWWPALGALLVSVFAHELGHAAALVRHGETPGAVGFRLVGLSPVLYADVRRSALLDRRGRIAVDLGGVYVQLLLAGAAGALHAATGSDAWMRAALLVAASAFSNLSPLPGFDGHWLLADALGVRGLGERWLGRLRGRDAAPQAPPGRASAIYAVALLAHLALTAWLALGVVGPAVLRELRGAR